MLLKNRFRKKEAQTGRLAWNLATVRLRKFLENARAFVSTVSDGREKLLGEYILDARYVTNLVDSVLEQTSMMVFDACALSPRGGEKLYKKLDEQRKLAGARFLSPAALSRLPEGDKGLEPEYRLLEEVMQWLSAEKGLGKNTMRGLFRDIVDHVAGGIDWKGFPEKEGSEILLETPGVKNRFLVLDLGRPEGEPPPAGISVSDVSSPPFGMLVMGAEEGGGEKAHLGKETRTWFAVLNGEHMNLFRTGPGRAGVWLCATLCGHPDSDFIFLLTTDPSLMPGSLPEGFSREDSKASSFAWTFGVMARDIETDLLELGKHWLDSPQAPGEKRAAP